MWLARKGIESLDWNRVTVAIRNQIRGRTGWQPVADPRRVGFLKGRSREPLDKLPELSVGVPGAIDDDAERPFRKPTRRGSATGCQPVRPRI